MRHPKTNPLQAPSRARRSGALIFLAFTLVAWANWANAQGNTNSGVTPGANPGFTRLTTTQQLQLDHLLQDLADSRLTLERRRNATIILIDDAWPQATRALRNLLGAADDNTVRAIAQALTMAVTPPPETLAPPLLERLDSPDTLLRHDIAQALARYPSETVLDALVTLAADPQKTIDHRLGAIQTLGSHRTRQAAEALLGLAQTAQPNIPPAAFEALAQLTGLGHLGQNLQEWNRWWRQVEPLSEERWLAELMRNITAHNAAQADQIQVLTQRIIDKNDQLYDSTDETNRPAILKQMLTDSLTPVRLQAISLIERRILNAQPVSEDVHQTMLQLLTDPSPDVRAAATRQFDRLENPPIGLIVQLLLDESENDPKVLAAQLALLAHQPQPEAVTPALDLIWRPHPAVRGAAARFLSAALDAQLLLDSQTDGAHTGAQYQLSQYDPPDTDMLHLIGQIGREEDRPLVAQYLQHNLPSVRLSAVRAFAANDWPTDALLPLLSDEALAPAIIDTLGARADDAESLITLLGASTQPPQTQPAWRDAQGAIASRLPIDDLIRADEHLAAQPDSLDTHETILKAAAALTHNTETDDPLAEPRRTEALFRLGELYQRSNQPAKAEDIYARLQPRTLTPENARRLAVAHMALLLQTKQFEPARQIAAALLKADPEQPADDIAKPWLALAEQAYEQDQRREATILAQESHRLFQSRLDNLNTVRLSQLLRNLNATPTDESAQANAPNR
jgi:hypothetical protein